MTEISLNILDVVFNSIRAEASLIEITVKIDQKNDDLVVIIKDNGCGMSKEQLQKAQDPFYTTRTTRKVGLGISFFELAAKCTGGSFSIESTPNVGTVTTASFKLSSIDRMPLGDITTTIHMLITMNVDIDFIYKYEFNERNFILDTREFREILEGVPFSNPDVSAYIKDFLISEKLETDNGVII